MSNAPDSHLGHAVAFNQLVWTLLQEPERAPEDDERMLHAAHASLMHWLSAGDVVNHQRGLWLISRVHAELGRGAEAMRYAKLCRALTDGAVEQLEPFDLIYCLEAEARAAAVSGDLGEARRLRADASYQAGQLAGDKVRALMLEDLRSGNWGQLQD